MEGTLARKQYAQQFEVVDLVFESSPDWPKVMYVCVTDFLFDDKGDRSVYWEGLRI